MDNFDVDSNYTSEDESEYSFGSSSQHSAYSLEMHRNDMVLDDDNTNQQELDDEENEDDENQSNRTPSDVWEHIDKVTDPEKPKLNAELKHVENLIKKLRKIVKRVRRTQLYLEELERLAIAANHTFKHPILDVKTRWNSVFLMAERALILKDDLLIIKSRHQPLQDIWLNEREWEKIEHLVNLLSQFHIATAELSTQTYPTIAYARVVLLGLLVDLNENRGHNYSLSEVLLAIRNKIQEYWAHIDKMTHVPAFFDPRYKTIAYKNLEINEILEPIRNNFPDSALSNLPSNNNASIFVQRLSSVRQQRNSNTDELLKYWESANASFDIEPLSWWHAHSTEYPILSKMAQSYLSVQASSVPCEQLFSLAGNVYNEFQYINYI
ncbi:unnamed protein product [Rhizophagus irregularis]|nr:unnamed protein product [Rhizophagus irregularis]